MGELHLEIIISRMQREFNTNVNVGKPQVVYREAIKKEGRATAVFDSDVSGRHHFGEVTLKVVPLQRGEGNKFISEIKPECMPDAFIPVIEKSVMESLETGALMGYPVVDTMVILTGGGFKETLSTDLAFSVSSSMACNEALLKGEPFLLEPVMSVDVFTPEQFVGEVIGDLNQRSGKIEAIEHKMGLQVIKAMAPLSKMFGYSTSLRSATQGRGTFTMQFSHFDKI